MYIWGLGGLYTTIQPRNRGFFSSEAEKNSRGHGPARGNFFAEDEKNPRLRRLYRCIQPDETPYIYNKYTTFLSQFAKEFTSVLKFAMEHSANTKVNDVVTNRQFNRFLSNAKLPSSWKCLCSVLIYKLDSHNSPQDTPYYWSYIMPRLFK